MADASKINHWLHILQALLPVVVFAMISVAVIVVAVLLVLRLLDFRRLLGQSVALLEMTPPAGKDKTPQATQELFSVLHGLDASRTLADKLLHRKVIFSLEVVSTRELGIRYMLRVNEQEARIFEHAIRSYLPDAKLQRISDYLPKALEGHQSRVVVAKQTGHYAYPLRAQPALGQYDPMAYLTGAMTKLAAGELVAFQVVVSPANVRGANALAQRLLHSEEFLWQLGKSRSKHVTNAFTAINNVLFGITGGVGEVVHGPSQHWVQGAQSLASHRQQAAMKIKPARTMSMIEQELATSVHEKLNQPLFRAVIRAVVVTSDKSSEKLRVRAVRDWFSSFGDPKYQALRARTDWPMHVLRRLRIFMFAHRMPTLFERNSGVYSAGEIAGLYHVPHTKSARAENVARSLSKTLPAQISLKDNPAFDVVLARNVHHGTSTDIGLTTAERERHVFIIGGTGNGKTTMMLYGMVQDLKNGKGFAFVDPHGDAAEEVLRHVPEERIEDVIYFNPDDLSHPIGLNLLEIPEGVIGDDLLREKDRVTEATISVFRKIFSDDGTGGHRIEYVLRNTIQTALTMEGATLFTIFRLLNDDDYRKGIVEKLTDEDLKNFWEQELGKAGDFQRVKMSAGITAKVGRFLFSASAKRILEQPRSTIDFEDIIDSGKVLICNFSKGLLGEDTSELFGITVLAKLQMAALRRARMVKNIRRPYYLYVDEFQNFATMSFVQMLSEARKYKLFLLMAEQSTSQQDEQQMVNVIFANVGTIICFRTGNPADERYVLPLFAPYIEPGEIANLPAYNFYARLSAMKSQEPTSGETIVLEDAGSQEIANRVQVMSRSKYAIVYEEAEAARPVAKSENKPSGHSIPGQKAKVASRGKKKTKSKT